MSDTSENPKKKRLWLRIILWILAFTVGVPLLATLVLLAISIADRADPSRHIPRGFEAYASVPSASDFTAQVLQLKTLDSALSGPSTQNLRSIARNLRANPFLQSKYFRKLADIRIDGAYYSDGEFVAVAELGWRSALTRTLSFSGTFLAETVFKIGGLRWNRDVYPPRYEYKNGESTVYVSSYKNLIIASSSEVLLKEAMEGTTASEDVGKLLSQKSAGANSLRLLVNSESLLSGSAAGSGPGASLLKTVAFPSLAVADVELSDENIRVTIRAQATSTDPGLAALLAKRSKTPAALARMPESVEYFSLLAAGAPEYLWSNFAAQLGTEVIAAKAKADEAAKALLGMTSDQLLFSWIGDEFGLFGTSFGPAPVFFAKIADEKIRRSVFDEVLGSMLVGRDVSAMVNGIRIPRVVFPNLLGAFLQSLGISLAEPFYLVEGGFLYASTSAETLAACVEQIRNGKLLSKTAQWDSSAGRIPAESSIMIYYNLDRSVPFFLRSGDANSNTLKLYNRGAASVSFKGGELRLDIAAARQGSSGTTEIAGYPVSVGSRMLSDPACALNDAGAPMAYWAGKSCIEAMDLSSGERFKLEMDDDGYVALEKSRGKLKSAWAVSKSGTIYRLDGKLVAVEGFPLVTGQVPSARPEIFGDKILIPINDGPSIMIVGSDGTKTYSSTMNAKLRSGPAVLGNRIAALPRSFDASVFLFDAEGKSVPGWPARLPGLASAAATIFRRSGPADSASPDTALVAAITEAGSLSVFKADGNLVEGFPIILEGVFDSAPIWAENQGLLLVLSTDGVVWQVASNGGLRGSYAVPNVKGRNSKMLAIDVNRDGREEIFIGNDGNSIAGLKQDFSPLPGFPLPGSGLPSFIDVDGDGNPEIVCRGTDDTIHAYRTGW